MVRYLSVGLTLALLGCGKGKLVCEDVQMTTSGGDPDSADLIACRQCQDACDPDGDGPEPSTCEYDAGGDYNTYTCDGTEYSVMSVCPDWPATCTPAE
jgi:hypothetical protein